MTDVMNDKASISRYLFEISDKLDKDILSRKDIDELEALFSKLESYLHTHEDEHLRGIINRLRSLYRNQIVSE